MNQPNSNSAVDDFTVVNNRKERVPPLFCYKADYFRLCDAFEEKELRFTASSQGKSTKIKLATTANYRTAVRVLEELSVEFHSFPLRNEMGRKYVIRGLPHNVEALQVQEYLSRAGVKHVKHVTQMKLSGRPAPLFIVYFEPGADTTQFLSLRSIRNMEISIEVFKGRSGPQQCFRCQRWGHSSAGCRSLRRCVHCGGDHDVNACPNKADKPKCCNCGGEHTANYRGCITHRNRVSLDKKPAAASSAPPKKQRATSGKAAAPAKAQPAKKPCTVPAKAKQSAKVGAYTFAEKVAGVERATADSSATATPSPSPVAAVTDSKPAPAVAKVTATKAKKAKRSVAKVTEPAGESSTTGKVLPSKSAKRRRRRRKNKKVAEVSAQSATDGQAKGVVNPDRVPKQKAVHVPHPQRGGVRVPQWQFNPDTVIGRILGANFTEFGAAVTWAQWANKIFAHAESKSDFERLQAITVVLSECPVLVQKALTCKEQ